MFEDGDRGLLAAALGDIARAKGMTQIPQAAGLERESLCKALSSGGNPESPPRSRAAGAGAQAEAGGVAASSLRGFAIRDQRCTVRASALRLHRIREIRR
ncbi:MAG: addiction module antidote protein [Xanthobacteraceae bacterium]